MHTRKLKTIRTDNDLGYYLAGLIEGDGHFSKKQLIISCHNGDNICFKQLIKHVGYGTLRPYSTGRASRFVICNKTGPRIKADQRQICRIS
jgi:hypothetical protein